MARPRNYAKEYQARRKRYKGLPARVAAGKGDVPAEIAFKAEKGKLTVAERRKYRAGLKKYEAKFGPVAGGRKGRKMPGEHEAPRTFASRQDAEEWAQTELGVSSDYYRVRQVGQEWRLTFLR